MAVGLRFLSLARLQEVAFHQTREGVVGTEILEVIDSATFRSAYFIESWPFYRAEFSTEFTEFFERRYPALLKSQKDLESE